MLGSVGNEGRRRWARGGTERTRTVLLEAAAEVFAERGYDGASVDEIARTAGVSVGSIYSRFGNKQGLFRALMADFLERDVTLARDRLAGGLVEGLSGMDERLRETADSRHRTLLDAETWVSAMRSPDLRAALAEHDRETRGAAARMTGEERERTGQTSRTGQAPRTGLASRTGQASRTGDEEVAAALLALYHGLLRQRRLDPDSVAPDLYSRLVLLLSRGLAVEADGDR